MNAGYQQRMREELVELEGRCAKIEDFLSTETYDNLPDVDQVLLLSQTLHMAGYYAILTERVNRLNAD